MTYEKLKSAIGSWLNNRGSEPTLAANLDLFIDLAEARINQDLRLQGMIKRKDEIGTGLGSRPLPDDFLEADRVTTLDGYTLECRPAEEIDRAGTVPEGPCFYAIDGRVITFAGPVDGYILRYFGRLPSLKGEGSHWLSEQSPNLYLYAALREANIFDLGEDREQQRYEQVYLQTVTQLQTKDNLSKWPQSNSLRAVATRNPVGRKASGT